MEAVFRSAVYAVSIRGGEPTPAAFCERIRTGAALCAGTDFFRLYTRTIVILKSVNLTSRRSGTQELTNRPTYCACAASS